MTLAERFWPKVDKTGDCWLWTAHLDRGGYGQIKAGGRARLAHRVAWELTGHTLIDGLDLDHVCRNRRCVNPAHLRQVTRKKNQENRSGPQGNSKSGVRGVSWSSGNSRWHVSVQHNYRTYFGGYFTSIPEAAEAAKELRLKLHTHNDIDRAND